MTETKTEKWSGPFVWYSDGSGKWWGFAQQTIHIDDWRDTPWGRTNFGRVIWGRRKIVVWEEIDKIIG